MKRIVRFFLSRLWRFDVVGYSLRIGLTNATFAYRVSPEYSIAWLILKHWIAAIPHMILFETYHYRVKIKNLFR